MLKRAFNAQVRQIALDRNIIRDQTRKNYIRINLTMHLFRLFIQSYCMFFNFFV